MRNSGLSGEPLSKRIEYWRWLQEHRQWWFMRPLPRDEFPTIIYTGLPGAGKTTFATDKCVRYLRDGVRVYSNIYLRDNYSGNAALPVQTWLDVMRASVQALEDEVPAIIYLAEINTMCDARDWQSTPRWWTEMMQQRRHLGIGLIGDTQHISQVEKRLRLLVRHVVRVRPTWLRERWQRWPVFVEEELDTLSSDDPVNWTAGPPRRVWQYSHAFHGHASWELLSTQDFGDLTTDRALAEIEALRQRAVSLNAVATLPSMADRGGDWVPFVS